APADDDDAAAVGAIATDDADDATGAADATGAVDAAGATSALAVRAACLRSTISARMLSATSSGNRPPRSRPAGLRIWSSAWAETPRSSRSWRSTANRLRLAT